MAVELVKTRWGLWYLQLEPKKPVAVVSERDIIRAVAQGLDLDKPAIELGNRPITVLDSDPILAATETMRRHNIRHVVVVNKEGELVGVLSVRDLCYERTILQELAREEYILWG